MRWGVADALAALGVDWQPKLLCGHAGDLGCVVETAFADARGMQGHGDQAIGLGVGCGGVNQAVAEQGRDGQLAMVFEARNQAVEWKGVGERGDGAVERGRVLKAGTAGLAAWRGGGALRAVRLAVPG